MSAHLKREQRRVNQLNIETLHNLLTDRRHQHNLLTNHRHQHNLLTDHRHQHNLLTNHRHRHNLLTDHAAQFAPVAANVPPMLPATISDFKTDEYLNSFSVDCCFMEEYDGNILKKRRVTYNHNAAVRNIEANLERYGLKLEVDSANLPVILSATIRPPFEIFRQFRSPSNRRKGVNLCVFIASQCHQLRSHGWVETSNMTEASTSIITDTTIPEIAIKLPSSTDYWRNWKKQYRSKWHYIVWYENRLKKSSQKERIAYCVNVKLYSTLKRIYEKLRDTLEDEGGKEKYINCKFEENKIKSVKRTKSCYYVDDLSAAL